MHENVIWIQWSIPSAFLLILATLAFKYSRHGTVLSRVFFYRIGGPISDSIARSYSLLQTLNIGPLSLWSLFHLPTLWVISSSSIVINTVWQLLRIMPPTSSPSVRLINSIACWTSLFHVQNITLDSLPHNLLCTSASPPLLQSFFS